MPLPRLTVVGYDRRFTTASRPFKGSAVDAGGTAIDVCVKPLLVGRAGCGVTLAAEVIGAVLGQRLGVPTPAGYLVSIDTAFLAATGGQLSDVEPGWAFGSAWVAGAYPWTAKPPGADSHLANEESVAGVTVMDTVIQNADRHGGNVVIAESRERRNAWELWYIDNAYAWQGGAQVFQAPKDEGLCRLVTDSESFGTPCFMAETLPFAELESLMERLQGLGWSLAPDHHSATRQQLASSAAAVRALVMANIARYFPNCRPSGS